MGSFRIFRRQTGRMIATVGLLAATIVPGFIPTLASAAIVSDRSIELSSSSKSAPNVTYKVTFTPVTASPTGAFAVKFCSNNPVIGDTCDVPVGMVTNGATSATAGFTDVTEPEPAVNRVVVAGTINAGTPVSVEIDGITNPSSAGTLYARIVTYDTKANATADTTETGAGANDNGGVALAITDSVAVSGRVLETMIFCVSGPTSDVSDTNPIGKSCDATLMTAPTLQLGDKFGDITALDASKVSSGDIYTQLSTNAISGAVVSLKSANDCGGLMRLGATLCDIAPAQLTNVAFGEPKVGVMVAADTATDTTQTASGTLEAVPASGYNDTTYALNYVSGGASGVTSPYGDPILDTNGTQPINRNMKLTFGASIAANTPAGNYTNAYSLVATGKF